MGNPPTKSRDLVMTDRRSIERATMALILVTGASSGLGRLTAAALVRKGHDVVAHVRPTIPGANRPVLPGVGLVLQGDLGRPDHVLEIAEEANSIGQFDAVIHNAAVFAGPDLFAVNVVAPYLITAVMRAPHRSIFVSSSMHTLGSSDLGAMNFDIGRTGSYEDSKLFVTTLAMLLARRRPFTMSHAVDPGWVPTRIGGRGATDSIDSGFRTQVWLATANTESLTPRTGGYWHHQRAMAPRSLSLDPGFQGRLLKKLESHVGLALAH